MNREELMNKRSQVVSSRSPQWSRLAIALFVVAGSWHVPSALAQTLSSITGTVTDSSGSLVQSAKVTATNDATAVAKTAITSSAGTYTITDLIPGTYTVKVENAGF